MNFTSLTTYDNTLIDGDGRWRNFKVSRSSRTKAASFGRTAAYHDTLADCQAEIADFNSDLRSDENVHGLASIQQSIMEDRV
jgi:hypothetical protein